MKIMCKSLFAFLLIYALFGFSAFAQTSSEKKNVRPNVKNQGIAASISVKKTVPIYFYHFSQPKFLISKILIEHDENGLGKIRFQRKNFEEFVAEHLKLSTAVLERLNKLWNKLNFLSSKEKYQSVERNYFHLGTVTLKMKKGDIERKDDFNWTENSDARALAEEYRKVSAQFIWVFDMEVARTNQPLEVPRLMKKLDSYLRRNAISDPKQMLSFLKELGDDERIPLIARNHALRLINKIEKSEKQKLAELQ